MNKLWGDGKDGPILVCVLEPGNIQRMVKENQPIDIDLNDGPYKQGLPAKLHVAILYSETPVADAKQFEKLLKPGGFHEDRRAAMSATKKPHCPECHSTSEQLGVMRGDFPVWLVFCSVCGCIMGAVLPIEELKK